MASNRFWWLLIGSAASTVSVVAIVGILITLGVLPAQVGLLFIVTLLALVVLFGRVLLGGETVRMYREPMSQTDMVRGVQWRGQYIGFFIFGVLILAAVFFLDDSPTITTADYIWIAVGVMWLVASIWGWFNRNERAAALAAQSQQQVAARQRAGVVGIVFFTLAAYILEWFNWPFYLYGFTVLAIGIVAGVAAYRVLTHRSLGDT